MTASLCPPPGLAERVPVRRNEANDSDDCISQLACFLARVALVQLRRWPKARNSPDRSVGRLAVGRVGHYPAGSEN